MSKIGYLCQPSATPCALLALLCGCVDVSMAMKALNWWQKYLGFCPFVKHTQYTSYVGGIGTSGPGFVNAAHCLWVDC